MKKDISFNQEMIEAIRNGRKTQTRRPIKKIPPEVYDKIKSITPHKSSKNGGLFQTDSKQYSLFIKCRYPVGEVLQVRGCDDLSLKVTSIRAERLQYISSDDAEAEGIHMEFDGNHMWYQDYQKKDTMFKYPSSRVDSFRSLWDSIYNNWSDNPWVWVISFEKLYKLN